jgi:hypothetical protein
MRGVAYLFSFVLLGTAVVQPQSPSSDVVSDPEAYRVYATLFPQLSPVASLKATNLVIQAETLSLSNRTLARPDCLPTGVPTGTPLEGDWPSVGASFKRENAQRRMLLPQFPVMGRPYQLVAEADIRSTIKPPEFYKGFYAKFPDSGGYYVVSAVGFNDAKTHAMVFIETYHGLLGASGKFYLLEKTDGQWIQSKIRANSCMWMS